MQDALHINTLPDNALDAASEFTLHWLPRIRESIESKQSLVIIVPAAASDHTDWRRAAVRDLARAYAPVRVNMISGGIAEAQAATLNYLDGAGGVTGQYLPLADDAPENGD